MALNGQNKGMEWLKRCRSCSTHSHYLYALQFTLTGSSSEFETVIESLEIGVEDISEAVAEVLASVTGTLRSSAQQGCSTDLDPSAQVLTPR